ncbi:MAG: aldose 1-epimerase [Solirubrobacteraceae bacterium]|jgi:galactose mutarotase-like enzyme
MTDRALERLHLRDRAAALEAEFVPGAGMLCCSLRHRGEELLAQNAGVDAYARHGKTMGIPLLYPWANRLAGFDYSVGGRSVRIPHDPTRVHLDANGLPIHGAIGGLMAWELVGAPDRPPAGTTSSLTARLSWSDAQPELFELFPFRHDLRLQARLRDGRLEIELTVHACGTDAVPLSFGFHPYLSPPGAARERWLVDLPAMCALALDAKQIPTGPAQELAAEQFELDGREFDDGFDAVAAPARFSVAGAGRLIELTFLQGYPCAQVFAPAGGQFICFEPMTAPTNALRSGEGLRLLAPGERFAASFSVAVSDSR